MRVGSLPKFLQPEKKKIHVWSQVSNCKILSVTQLPKSNAVCSLYWTSHLYVLKLSDVILCPDLYVYLTVKLNPATLPFHLPHVSQAFGCSLPLSSSL